MGLFSWMMHGDDARRKTSDIGSGSDLEMIRLMVRRDGDSLAIALSKSIGNSSLSLVMMNVAIAQIVFTDSFYETLDSLFENCNFPAKGLFNNLADELHSDYRRCQLITSRLYGITLAIFMKKAASMSNTIMNRDEAIRLINSSKMDESLKDGLRESFCHMEDYYDDPLADAVSSHDLGILAYSLVDKKLGQGHYADPLYMMAMATAEKITLERIVISDNDVNNLTQLKLIVNKSSTKDGN